MNNAIIVINNVAVNTLSIVGDKGINLYPDNLTVHYSLIINSHQVDGEIIIQDHETPVEDLTIKGIADIIKERLNGSDSK